VDKVVTADNVNLFLLTHDPPFFKTKIAEI